MIRLILNKIPRPVLQRLARWAMPLVRAWYAVGRGKASNMDGTETGIGSDGSRGVECPVCGGRYRRFMPYGYVEVRPNALCPGCLSLERHRLLWLWLVRETDLLKPLDTTESTSGTNRRHDFLHIAPEVCLMRRFEELWGNSPSPARDETCDSKVSVHRLGRRWTDELKLGRTETSGDEAASRLADGFFETGGYVTVDLESPLARVHADVQALPFDDESFDVVFCNHVLEHVADDRQAMSELYRVLRGGGWGVLMVPMDEGREETLEDDSITDPAERTRIFGQYDHCRVYGRDYAERLRGAGFEVEEVDFAAVLTPEELRRHALRRETIHVVRKS